MYGDIAANVNQAALTAAQQLMPTLEIRTTVAPPIVVPLDPAAAQSSAAPSALLSALKPTVVLHTDFGDVTVAPYGPAAGIATGVGSWTAMVALAGLAFAGLFFWLGRESV